MTVSTRRGALLRRLAVDEKAIVHDTGWRAGATLPRYAPVFPKTVPARPGWEWRSLEIISSRDTYTLFVQAAPTFGKWKAFLIAAGSKGAARVLLRIEAQPGKSGLHVHAPCDGPLQDGPRSINAMSHRLPPHDAFHRRNVAWTKASFFRAAANILRITVPFDQGDLFDVAGGGP